MSTIKLPAASGGGSISLKGPSSLGSDRDLVDTSGHINLLDSQNLKVGTGADLQIYHDGSNSWIKNTTGNTVIHTGTGRFKVWSDGNEEMIDAAAGGAVKLYYDDATKIETISTGINVTGGIRLGGNNTANELQDYEEGDWTPASREGTITYSNAKYTKIGQLVWVNAVVTSFSERTTTTDIGVTGLPFQVAETCTGSCVFSRVAYTGDTQIASIANTSNRVQFLTSSQSSSGTWFYLDYEDLQASSSTIEFSIVYRTTA